VQVVANERNPGSLGDRIITAFEDAGDIALFYYVGHGQVGDSDQLGLGLPDTRTEYSRRAVTSLTFDVVRQALRNSPAAIKIVILDCCFSGLAASEHGTLGPDAGMADLADGTGAYTITASGAYQTAWFEGDAATGDPQTVFTKCLADRVEAGIPGAGPWLRMHRLYLVLREDLARIRGPVPEARGTGTAGEFAFAHNAASGVALARPVIGAGHGRPLADVCSDAPAGTDMIGAAPDVETLADLIAAAETAPPLAVALIGEWGAGKSSAMLQIERRVDLLAEISRSNPGQSAFTAAVRQVRFNAWDYSDDQVWCGLVDHLFGALAAGLGGAEAPPASQDERVALRRELAATETEEQRLGEALRAADRAARPTRFPSGFGSPAYAARIVTAAGRELFRDARSAAFILAGWAFLGAAAYEAWSLWGAAIGSAAAVAAAAIVPVSALARQAWRWHRAGQGITTWLRRRLDEQQRALSSQRAELRERLALIDASARLSAFLASRAAPGAYEKHRGLLGQVRRDLASLCGDLASARTEWEAAGSPGPPPLERVVLYIDDLDRCPPRRVVEVLEAVHLMLAFDLFIVVVAVDARWLIRSLDYHYHELFSTSSSAPSSPAGQADSDSFHGAASPADYLDKIFQIPYALAPAPPAALGRYLQSLFTPPGFSAAGQPPPAADSNSVLGQPERNRIDPDSQDQSGHRGEADPIVQDLSRPGLRLSQHEIDFMARLGAMLHTPRAVKRLANLYRLIRVSIPDADSEEFTGTQAGGPYQVIQILLAILAGQPAAAQPIFTELMSAAPGSDILQVLGKAAADDFPEASACRSISAALNSITAETAVMTTIEEYQRWCPVVARYSFHTRTMTG
jgi:hypothetical protein